MRILFVSLINAYWGGSEVLWSQAAHAAVRQKWTVGAYFPFRKTTPEIRDLNEAGVELYFGSAEPKRWWRRIGQRTYGPTEHFRRAVQAFSPELVVFTQGCARDGIAEMNICFEEKRKYVIVNQAVEPLYYHDNIWANLRTVFTNALYVWFVSVENREALLAFLCLELTHSEPIANSYQCSYDVTCPWPKNVDGFCLAVVGRLEIEQKGHEMLLQVLAGTKWRRRALCVTIFGSGNCKESLSARTRHLDLQHVTFAPPEDVFTIWRRHHALVLPSRFEGQSLAMLEAMLHGRPVIATAVGGTAGVVISGKTGFLAEHADIKGLDVVLERAWERRHDWEILGANAAKHIRRIVSPHPGNDFIIRLENVVSGRPNIGCRLPQY